MEGSHIIDHFINVIVERHQIKPDLLPLIQEIVKVIEGSQLELMSTDHILLKGSDMLSVGMVSDIIEATLKELQLCTPIRHDGDDQELIARLKACKEMTGVRYKYLQLRKFQFFPEAGFTELKDMLDINDLDNEADRTRVVAICHNPLSNMQIPYEKYFRFSFNIDQKSIVIRENLKKIKERVYENAEKQTPSNDVDKQEKPKSNKKTKLKMFLCNSIFEYIEKEKFFEEALETTAPQAWDTIPQVNDLLQCVDLKTYRSSSDTPLYQEPGKLQLLNIKKGEPLGKPLSYKVFETAWGGRRKREN